MDNPFRNDAEENMGYDRALLEKIMREVKENQQMLRGMQRAKEMKNVGSIVRMVVLIGLLIAGWIFIRPYFQKLTNLYEGASENIETLNTNVQQVGDTFGNVGDFFQGRNPDNVIESFFESQGE